MGENTGNADSKNAAVVPDLEYLAALIEEVAQAMIDEANQDGPDRYLDDVPFGRSFWAAWALRAAAACLAGRVELMPPCGPAADVVMDGSVIGRVWTDLEDPHRRIAWSVAGEPREGPGAPALSSTRPRFPTAQQAARAVVYHHVMRA
jgi:hypothetical protein